MSFSLPIDIVPPPDQAIDLAQALGRANALWNAGQAAEADSICRRVLASWPGQPDVLHLLGLHILGGCPMGATKNEGVVDEFFRVHSYPNMFILDGSIMPCNLGVNPSLTITALSEYAAAS